MLTIPADIILEKNKLFSGDSFIELLEWQVSETDTTVRVANYNENVYWGHYTWTKFRFEGGGEHDSGGDSAETVQIKVSAIDRVIQGQLETLTNGGVGDTVIYRRVHSGYLHLGAVITASFSILDIDAGPSDEWVIFNLGQENFFLSQFPANVFRRDVCRYRPTQTDVCSYVNDASCNRSFDNCIYLGQESVFGGQPGIPGGVFNIQLVRGLIKQLSLDAKLAAPAGQTISTSLDAILYGYQKLSLDAVIIPGTGSKTLSIDALLNQPGDKPYPPENVNIDALINELVQQTLSLDAKTKAIGQTSSTAIDSVIYGELTLSLDARFEKIGATKAVDINALLNKAITEQLSLDAIILLNEAETLLDTQLQATGQISTLSIDAIIYGLKTISLDAQLEKINNASTFSIDSFLKKTYQENTYLDAKLNSEQTESIGLDSMLYAVGSYSESAKLDAILYGDYVEDTEGDAIQDTEGDYIEEPT